MNWLEVPRQECVDLGLIVEGDQVTAALFDLANLFKPQQDESRNTCCGNILIGRR